MKVEECRQKYMDYARRFAQKSLRMTNNNQTNEFEQIAIEMCDSFIKDDNLLKQQIPHGLSLAELECIRGVAASRGLSITKLNRFNVETSFLTKKSYYSKETY